MIKIGLIDSGISEEQQKQVLASRGFIQLPDSQIIQQDSGPDTLGHGTAIASILLTNANAQLVNAQVFGKGHSTTPAVIAAALYWLVEDQQAKLINMSFGLQHDRGVLRRACEQALAAGAVLLAAAPARGLAVYPAAYPGVIRVTGDARCQSEEFSYLGTQQADFGASMQAAQADHGAKTGGGASYAVPHITAVIAHYLSSGGEAEHVFDYLQQQACYHGPEQR